MLKKLSVLILSFTIFNFLAPSLLALSISPLTKDTPVTLSSLSRKSALYYTFTVPNNLLSLSVSTTGSTGDIDIYLNKDKIRTSKISTWRSTKSGSSESITLSRPTGGTYYLTALAYTATTNTTITLKYVDSVTGVTTLLKNVPVQVTSLSKAEEKYFSFSLPSGSSNLVVTTTGTTGDADIFLSPSGIPTPKTALLKSTTDGSNERIAITSPNVGTYYLTLRAYTATSNTTVALTYTTPSTLPVVTAPSSPSSGGGASAPSVPLPTAPVTPAPVPTPAPTPTPVSGSCGTSANQTLSASPTSNLCVQGSFSSVSSNASSYLWSCSGVNGGATVSCVATKTAVVVPTPVAINGTCGTSANQTLSSLPTSNLCTNGTPSTVSDTSMYMWSCTGLNGGTTASCHADKTVQVVVPPVVSTGEYLWSNPQTWGGTLPTAGQAVTIPAGKTIILDQDTPALGKITVQGTLRFADKDIALTMLGMTIASTGALEIGKVNVPYTKKAIITVNGLNNGNATDRGIVVEGGRLELYGTAPSPVWTKLNDHAQAGSKSLTLLASTNWKAGDSIILASTELPNSALLVSQRAVVPTELLTATSSSGSTLNLIQEVDHFHFGKLQYATDQGMSYIKGFLTKTSPETVDTLDERAEVGNLTRNITIQAPNDTLWQTSGFGSHIMIMGLASQVRVDGVRFERGGQSGIVARYPIHWHLLSYDPATGNLLGDPVNNYIKNSAITNSAQRCIVIHATNGITIANNICYNISGHAIFLEDGSERRNVIEGNLTMLTKVIPKALATQVHETSSHCGGGTTGYWLTNPDNTVRNNSASDSSGSGFWLSYGEKPVKQSKLVSISPGIMDHGSFEDNTSHSNDSYGLMLECNMIDDLGNVTLRYYIPTIPSNIVGVTSYKNGRGGYLNRAVRVNYLNWAVADNGAGGFQGAVQIGTVKNALVVGKSLNDGKSYESTSKLAGPQFGIASYHSEMSNINNIFVNFKSVGSIFTGQDGRINSGSLGMADYYTKPVEKGIKRSPGNIFINADPGFRALPPHIQSDYTLESRNNWTLAGAIWDPYGYWSTPGNYLVFDHPFLRSEGCQTVYSKYPAGMLNGLTCPNRYYGAHNFRINIGMPNTTDSTAFREKLNVERLTKTNTLIGSWVVEEGFTSTFLGNMRHFAATKGDRYILRFPLFPNASVVKEFPKAIDIDFTNINEPGDSLVIGVTYSKDIDPSKVFVSTNPDWGSFAPGRESKKLTATSSLAAVEAGDGSLYWQDKANNLVWVKLVDYNLNSNLHLLQPNDTSDTTLYEKFTLRIAP